MILAFTGAGISKASGIPTFEEQGDMRNKLDRYYYREHKDEVEQILENMQETFNSSEPNDEHKAIAEYDIPVITMTIDGLHQKAGSKNVLAVHGEMPNIVLYGDPAPLYATAFEWVDKLRPGDSFMIVGVSFYTTVSEQLRVMARATGANIIIINENAEENVRAYINNNKYRLILATQPE